MRCRNCPHALHSADKCPRPESKQLKWEEQLRRSYGGNTNMNLHLRVKGRLV